MTQEIADTGEVTTLGDVGPVSPDRAKTDPAPGYDVKPVPVASGAKRYRCTVQCFLDGRLYEPGQIALYAGKPNRYMEPLEDAPPAAAEVATEQTGSAVKPGKGRSRQDDASRDVI